MPDDAFEDTNCDGIDGDRTAAVFVSPSGADTAPGTLEAPVRTISKAIALAAADTKYILVANGSYPETIVIDAAMAPLTIYGGYAEKTWQRVNDRGTVAPSEGTPLTIRNTAAAIAIDRLAFKAPDATAPGASSVAIFAVGSSAVTLAHVALEAGRGANGETPIVPPTDTAPGPDLNGAPGLPGEDLGGGAPCVYPATSPEVCTRYTRGGNQGGTVMIGGTVGWGGRGGEGGNFVLPRLDDGRANGVRGGGFGGFGGTWDRIDGEPGGNGSPGGPGQPGASLGTLTEAGYQASNGGTKGETGTVGSGGGGGHGGASYGCLSEKYAVAGGGGQGGHGGRPGRGAPGSSAGGASIGLLAFNSTISIANTTISTSAGGAGGDAAAGADGQVGGAGGAGGRGQSCAPVPTASPDGGKGGKGGNGGRGGASGAGGGGPSFGILHLGPAPTRQLVTVNVGTAGKGGSGIDAPNGADSLAADIYEMTP